MEMSLSISEILVAVMTLIAAGLGFIIKEQREKIKTIQNQLSDKNTLFTMKYLPFSLT